MADNVSGGRTPTKPALGAQSVPRIYYYKTRHYKPEVRRRSGRDEQPHEIKPLAHDDGYSAPVSSIPRGIPPLEGAEVGRGRSTLTKQNWLQIAFFLSILLLAIWWVFFNGQFPSLEQTPPPTTIVTDKGDRRSDTYWEGRMRALVKDEFTIYLGEKIHQMKRIKDDLSKVEELFNKWNNEAPELVGSLQHKLEEERKRVEDHFSVIQKKLSDFNLKSEEYSARIANVKAELEAKIAAISKAGLSAEEKKALSDLTANLAKLEADFRASKGDSGQLDQRLTAFEATVAQLKGSVATKQSLEEIKNQLDRMTNELASKEKIIEDRVKGEVLKHVTTEYLKSEITAAIKQLTPKDDLKLDALSKELEKQKVRLDELIKKGVPASTPGTPSQNTVDPKKLLQDARGDVDSWITDAIAKATPGIIDSAKEQLTIPSEQQKKAIESWLAEKYGKQVPALIDDAVNKVSTDLQAKINSLKDDLAKLDRIAKQPIRLDSETKELIVKQLRADGVVKGLTEEEVLRIVESKLDLFAADRVNMTDYALETGGAKVVHSSSSPNYRGGVYHWLAGTATHSATVILSPVGSMRGKCWAFKGDSGFVTIQLPFPVKVSAFTLEHIPRSLAVTPGAAPKRFQVLGVESPHSTESDLLGEYEYILREEKTVQTFAVQTQHLPQNASLVYQFIALSIQSNHGNPDFTCVYRFRVHGEPAVTVEGDPNAKPEDKLPAAAQQ